MIFEYSEAKAERNKEKHGVGFREAVTVLAIHSRSCSTTSNIPTKKSA